MEFWARLPPDERAAAEALLPPDVRERAMAVSMPAESEHEKHVDMATGMPKLAEAADKAEKCDDHPAG